MPAICIIGVQWGDEGKGKIIDVLAKDVDYVVRYQGGANAGHTVVQNSRKFIFHHIPSGILHPKVKCIIANGVVLDLPELLKEINDLKKAGVKVDKNLLISDRAHIVMPYHKLLDSLSENSSKLKIGTTLRGIGPCYQDKVARKGFRLCDILNPKNFKERLQPILEEKNKILSSLYAHKRLSFSQLYEELIKYGCKFQDYIADTISIVNQAIDSGRMVLFEGAQGALLSVDFGTYPFVTSSNSDACGISQGAGVSPGKIDKIIGVAKAYQTRVGEGPLPSEMSKDLADHVRKKGAEFGATTGRPRRIGWFDAVSVRFSVLVNGIETLCMTKLDVLSGIGEIKVCIGYKTSDGRIIRTFPAYTTLLSDCEPVYKTLPGWQEDISSCTSFSRLPQNARRYVNFIEQQLKIRISIVSVGNERDKTIFR